MLDYTLLRKVKFLADCTHERQVIYDKLFLAIVNYPFYDSIEVVVLNLFFLNFFINP
jgi:hypothetical protein